MSILKLEIKPGVKRYNLQVIILFIAKQNTPPLGAKLAERPTWVTLFLAGEPEGQNPVMPRPIAAGIGILSLPILLTGLNEPSQKNPVKKNMLNED